MKTETCLTKRIGDLSKYCWNGLFNSEDGLEDYIPEDIFVELVRPIYDWESDRINQESKKDLNELENNKLKERNKIINSVDVLSEENAEQFLNTWFLNIDLEEGFLKDLVFKLWFEILKDFSEDLGERYIKLVVEFSNKYSLRYTLRKTGEHLYVVQLRPEVIALEELLLLKMSHVDDYAVFSREFSDLLTNGDPHVFKKILKGSSDLVEYAANVKAKTSGKTLVDAVQKISPHPFPHKAAKDSLEKIYGFYSDYKGIRHGGGTEGLRQLEEKDAITFSIVSALFANYLIKD